MTANIGTLLDLYGVEKGLEHYRSTTTLNFDQYKYYLQREVFSSLPDKLPLSALREFESRIAETCWLFCRKKYSSTETSKFSEASAFRIFRIFCVLAELVEEEEVGSYKVWLHPTEAAYVAQALASSLGSPWDEEDFTDLCVSIGSLL